MTIAVYRATDARRSLVPLLVVAMPAVAYAYLAPTGGGFLLQLLLGGITGFVLIAGLLARRLLSKIRRIFCPER